MLKRIFLGVVIATGLFGLTSTGSSFTGISWLDISISADPFEILDMDAGCDLFVELGPVTVTSESILDESQGWLWQAFSAFGGIGALDVRLDTLFGPSTGDFLYMQFISSITLSGVEIGVYGAQLSDAVLGGAADGWALKLQGTAFSLDVTSVTEFGARIADADFDGITIVHAATGEERHYLVDPLVVGQGFTGQKVSMSGFEIGCIHGIGAVVYLGCDGFDYLALEATEIDLGIPWLSIGTELRYEIQTKSFTAAPRVVLANSVCITPHLALAHTLNANAVTIDGIAISGIELEYTWKGVTIRDITVLDMGRYAITTEEYGSSFMARPQAISSGYDFYPDYWEMIGVQVERSACCGEPYHVLLNTYFDHDSGQLFDWALTYAEASVPLSQHLTVSGDITVSAVGIHSLGLGMALSW